MCVELPTVSAGVWRAVAKSAAVESGEVRGRFDLDAALVVVLQVVSNTGQVYDKNNIFIVRQIDSLGKPIEGCSRAQETKEEHNQA
jgi:hypothetical protein